MAAAFLRSRVVMVWTILVGATVGSLTLFESVRSSGMRRYVSVAVVVIALVKVRFVGLDFMELRQGPAGLRLAFEFWLVAIGGVLVTLYWLQTSG
jgi:hypothetical protein